MTPKQEAFARAYVETGNACEAYRRAYTPRRMSQKAITVEATRLLKHPSISLAVEQSKQATAKRHAITLDYLSTKLEAALDKAMSETKGASAAVSAVMGLGKLHGLVTEKREVTYKQGIDDISDAELGHIARSGSAGASAAQGGSAKPN